MAEKPAPEETQKVDEIVGEEHALRSDRSTWHDHWQACADTMHPRRGRFTASIVPGERLHTKLYDSTPIQARQGLASSIDGLLKPKTAKWFSLTLENTRLAKRDDVKRWLEACEDRLRRAMYNPKARFIPATRATDNDLVTFGTGCVFIGERQRRDGLLFRDYALHNTVIDTDDDGNIKRIYIQQHYTPRQAAARYGKDKISETIEKELSAEKKNSHQRFRFIWCVKPRHEFDPRKIDNRNMPFESYEIDVAGKKVMREGGFPWFPFAVPRWDLSAEEIYGRSPGMVALGDTHTLQQQGKTLLRAGHKEVEPPLLVPDEGVVGAPRTFPGGITYFDAELAREMGSIPIQPLNSGGNISIGRDMQEDTRENIWRAFFRNVLQLPVNGPEMTATEVIERKDEFTRLIGPVFGMLESDYSQQLVEIPTSIMFRVGAFPRPPDDVRGEDLKFEFESPVEKARKQIESMGLSRSLQVLEPFIAAQPELMDHFDGDTIARDTPEAFGVPQRWLRTLDKVSEIRQGRQQEIQARQAIEGMQAAADIDKTIAEGQATRKQ